MFGDSPLLFSFFERAKPQKAAWQREGMRVHCISSTASGSRAKIYAKRGGGQEKRRGGVHIASLAVVPGIKLTSIALSSLAVQRNKPLMSWSFACLMVINALAAGHGQKPPVAAICSPSHVHLNQPMAPRCRRISMELFRPDVDADACSPLHK